ncbi:MAG TPA: glycosyltransferase [Flavisolibacter sp.]|jgi:cellulose synthase/poly-beta-1,6-N-acetylglucosamine synthase-like glycosyltransferase|nr:glycosyltransferase [Flavisolibacter sp.]
MFWLLFTAIFLLLYALLISFYWNSWKKLDEHLVSPDSDKRFLSVIVPARNEEKNIGFLLNALSQQTYPVVFFEIIVVDDFSDDNTAELVSSFSITNLSLIQPRVSSELSSKKRSIEAGITKAKGELIITTDADCIPTKNWLQTINHFYTKHDAAFIAAPVKFFHNNSLLQLFQSLDFLTLQGITAASVSANFHTMCNGANLAYKKKTFEEVNGFQGIDKVATGDDMLLMHKIWKHYPGKALYLKSKEAIVTSQPMYNWKDLFMQRKRWASKTLVYDDYRIMVVLAFVYLLNCLFVALIVASIFQSFYWWYVIGFIVVKTIIEFPFVNSVAKFYNEQRAVKFLFLFQPIHILYTVLVGLLSQFGKYEWKGRKTK